MFTSWWFSIQKEEKTLKWSMANFWSSNTQRYKYDLRYDRGQKKAKILTRGDGHWTEMVFLNYLPRQNLKIFFFKLTVRNIFGMGFNQ